MATGNYLGPAVIEQVRKIDPAAYLRVVPASCRDKWKLMCRLMCFTTPNQLWKLSGWRANRLVPSPGRAIAQDNRQMAWLRYEA